MEVQVGDFITVPAWGVTGMVMNIKSSYIGPEGSIDVLLQHDVDEPSPIWQWYRLTPGTYTVE